MTSRFFSIEDILAEEERVPCVFFTHAYRLGHLDPQTGSTDIEDEQKVEIPLWLAERLVEHRFVGAELPRNFSSRVRDALLAAPESVALRTHGPYFYEAGLRLSALVDGEEAARLPAAIQATLATRVNMILRRSQNSDRRDASKFLEPLTDLEQALFWAGYRHARDKLTWRLGRTGAIRSGAAAAAAASFAPSPRTPHTSSSRLASYIRAGASASAGSGEGGAGGSASAGAADGYVALERRSIMGGAYKRKRTAVA